MRISRATERQFSIAATGVLCLGVLLIPTYLTLVSWAASDASSVHISDAEPYYRKQVQPFFRLPKEAKIDEVKTGGDYFPEGHTITFTLPDSRTPGEWLKETWSSNGLPAKDWMAKRGEYRIEWVDRKAKERYEVPHSTKWGGRRLLHLDRNRFMLQIHGTSEMP